MSDSQKADASQRRWFRSGPGLVWERGLGEGIVFDPSSGETHFLNELPSLILSVIDEIPVTHEALIERLAGPVSLDSQARSQVIDALVFLESAELVESRPS